MFYNLNNFMVKNKGKILLSVIFSIGLIFIFSNLKAKRHINQDDKHRRILTAVTNVLKSDHYAPPVYNDDFSKKLFDAFLNELDQNKNLFTIEDIVILSKYEKLLDDEITGGAPIQFYTEVFKYFENKIELNLNFINEYLSAPLQLNTFDIYNPKPENEPYPANEQERIAKMKLYLRYLVLQKYTEAIDNREKTKNEKGFKFQTNEQLEATAREEVKKSMVKNFTRFKTSLNDDKKFGLYINTIAAMLDPHTNYLPPTEKRSFEESLSAKFYGIGALLAQDETGVKIASVQPGGPAWKSGKIDPKDIILKVAQGNDGEFVDLSGIEVSDAIKLIRGNKGTTVKLMIKKINGTIITVIMVREEILIDEVYAKSVIIDNKGEKIGYIKLGDFYFNYDNPDGEHNCSKDIEKEIEKLKNEKVKSIILDLRSNGGGSLAEVVKIAGMFIDQGPIVQTRDRFGRTTPFVDRQPGTLFDGNLAVMINEYSASASEIFAAAIQDYKRGIIVGGPASFGKGTVQRQFPIGEYVDNTANGTDLGSVKMTFQKFYRVTGSSTQRKGVESDVVLPSELELYKFREQDEKNALPWDEVRNLNFTIWNNAAETDKLIAKSKLIVKNDTSFSLYANNLKWLKKNFENPINLNYDLYKKNNELVKQTISQNSTFLKFKTPLKVSVSKEDYPKFYNNIDKQKQERYQGWLKSLEADKYIAETVKILASNE